MKSKHKRIMKQRLLYIIIGVLLAMQALAQSTTKYEYDTNNRLARVIYSNGLVVSYTYDKLGNRLSRTVSSSLEPDYIAGDSNGDGSITVTDAVMIISYILGESPAGFNKEAADVNGDSSITVTDAVQVIDMILQQQ